MLELTKGRFRYFCDFLGKLHQLHFPKMSETGFLWFWTFSPVAVEQPKWTVSVWWWWHYSALFSCGRPSKPLISIWAGRQPSPQRFHGICSNNVLICNNGSSSPTGPVCQNADLSQARNFFLKNTEFKRVFKLFLASLYAPTLLTSLMRSIMMSSWTGPSRKRWRI